MNFEDIDWEAEAKRVARAFGAQGECWFENNDWYWFLQSEPAIASTSHHGRGLVPIRSGLFAECHYSRVNRYFVVVEADEKELRYTGISLDWNGNVTQSSPKQPRRIELAAALYHLGLLTSEVEAALNANISAHQKMEWALELE